MKGVSSGRIATLGTGVGGGHEHTRTFVITIGFLSQFKSIRSKTSTFENFKVTLLDNTRHNYRKAAIFLELFCDEWKCEVSRRRITYSREIISYAEGENV